MAMSKRLRLRVAGRP